MTLGIAGARCTHQQLHLRLAGWNQGKCLELRFGVMVSRLPPRLAPLWTALRPASALTGTTGTRRKESGRSYSGLGPISWFLRLGLLGYVS